MANTQSTPKKSFELNGKIKLFSKRLHWFKSNRVFTDVDPYLTPIEFTCRICNTVIKAKFPRFENLTHHFFLDNHASFKKWFNLEGNNKSKLTLDMLDFIKYIVSSYGSFQQIKNPFFEPFLKAKLKDETASYKTIRYL